MTNPGSGEHPHYLEQIAAYVAGGLEPQERSALESHILTCPTCAAALQEALEIDRSIDSLFADARPSADFEDRLLQSLRQQRARRLFLHPAIRRTITGLAAALVLGTIGYAVTEWLPNSRLAGLVPLSHTTEQYAASSLHGESSAQEAQSDQLGMPALQTPERQDRVALNAPTVRRAAPSDVARKEVHLYGATNRDAVLGRTAKGSSTALGDAVAAPRADYFFKPADNTPKIDTEVVREKAAEVVREKIDTTSQVAAERGEEPLSRARVLFAAPQAAPAAPAAGAPIQESNPPVAATQLANRKIIRNGEIEFEVNSYDASFALINKIAAEEGGFVASTNSDKLPNGKVRGTIVVRVTPDRLDTLILKLRAIGDLRTQRIAAQDVTKAYTDLGGELKAARAMEERLLSIIKTGQGQIKDLLEVEKQLGVYRAKIEKLEGELRYYDNQIALSTLSISLYERDIKTPASATQTEQVSMGIETDDVEKIRNATLQAIEQAKGRVVESNLKRLDAGQFAASIICEVPPDAAGPLVDRLKQAGRVARLDIDRKQTPSAGSGVPATSRIERLDTRLVVSIYNLANIAPRQTTSLTLAARSVEEIYRSILNQVTTKNGRVITSTLNRHSPEQTTASISFEVPSSDADATLQEIRRDCETMALTVTENPDTNNVTAAKRGFNVQVCPLSTVPPQQTLSMSLETPDVEKLAAEIVSAAESAGGRTAESPQFSSTARRATGHLIVDVPAAKTREFRDQLKAIATVLQSESSKNPQSADSQVARTRFDLTLTTPDAEQGLIAALTRGLTISARGLLWSLQLIVVGLLFVAPWVLVVAGLWKLWRRRRQAQETPQ